jgi:hypothetical protein
MLPTRIQTLKYPVLTGVPVAVNTTEPLPVLNVPAGAEIVIPFTFSLVKAA